MNIKLKSLLSLLLVASFCVQAEQLDYQQVLQKVIDHYPSIKLAALQVERARLENIKAESQLSWQLNGNAGYAHDTSLFGTPSDRYNLGASLNRNLSSGGVLGFNADITRDEADQSFSPIFPNPSTKTRLDVNYRHHLQKGSENAQYTESLTAAEAGVKSAESSKAALYDNLASQVIELYLAAATTQARIKNIENKIERGLRLKDYISKEFALGLAEDKDVLQNDARLATDRADKQGLQVMWKKQLISLNRLMNQQWQSEFTPDITFTNNINHKLDAAYEQARQQNAELKQIEARLLLADSAIRLSKDKRQDELDVVMFLGNESTQGDVVAGDYNESEMIGGIRLEYKRGLDKSGVDAELRQAHYDRELALQDKALVLQNLKYNVASLLVELESAEQAVKAFTQSVTAEKNKLKEATKRYKDGRIETDRLIDFESQLATAELSFELQKIELARRVYQLDLLRGEIWKTVLRPEISLKEYADKNNQLEKGIN